MPQPEFWYEENASLTTLHGPGVSVTLGRLNAIEHSLLLSIPAWRADESDPAPPLVFVHATADDAELPPDPRRVTQPVYQEVVRHEPPAELGAGLCMLLTGSWFDHHFSAVFCLYRDRTIPCRVVFDVDVADRCRAPIAKLAATYRVDYAGAAHAALDVSPAALLWQFGPRSEARLEFLALGGAAIGARTSNRVQVDAAIDPSTHTQRLHYQWLWTS